MNNNFFSQDIKTDNPVVVTKNKPVNGYAEYISAEVSEKALEKGREFAKDITEGFVSDFEKTKELMEKGITDECDFMAHVSTFIVLDDTIYVTYYANTKEAKEDPNNQSARLVYCPVDNVSKKVFLTVQSVGDMCGSLRVNMVYDTILMQKDETTLCILWTAKVGDNYYRLYRMFDTVTKEFGKIGVNRFKVGDVTNDFSTTGIQTALAHNNLPIKKMFSDIGIMQKQSKRTENGEEYCYSGAYSGDFTCIIKTKDYITWEYVSQPDFDNDSLWENATYVLGDKVYYFVRQHDEVQMGFLTAYDLISGKWEKPVLIADCQSRSDFIYYKNELYLFHAPLSREHIGIVHIDTNDISKSEVVLQAKMDTSCFYPFVERFIDVMGMSYTIDRKHIRLATFDMDKYLK